MKQSRIRIANWKTGAEEDVLIRSEQATETIVLNDLDVESDVEFAKWYWGEEDYADKILQK